MNLVSTIAKSFTSLEIRKEGSSTSPRRDEELAGEASQLHHASGSNANDFVRAENHAGKKPYWTGY